MPLFFALLMGLIFQPKEQKETAIRVNLLVEDRDESAVSRFILGAFGNKEMGDLFHVTTVDSGAGRPMMDAGKASALLIIPEGLGESLLNQRPAWLTLIKNPSEAFAPKIAEETVEILAEGGDRLITLLQGPLQIMRLNAASDHEYSQVELGIIAFQVYQIMRKIDGILIPPLITLNSQTSGEEQSGNDSSNVFAYILASILVMSILFILEVISRDFFNEQEKNTFKRQRIAIGMSDVIIAKLIFVYLSGLFAYSLVWAVGIPSFGIKITLHQGIDLAVFAFVLIAACTGVISFIFALAKTRSQAQSVAPAVILGFSMLGGAMIPINNLPLFIQRMAVISPVYWGIDAMHRITLENASLPQIGQHLLVLSFLSLVLLIPSLLIQQRKYRS